MFNIKKKRRRRKKKVKFSKIIVVICITFIVLYTITQVILSNFLGMELTPTLTTAVYAFFGTELAVMALIRIFEKEDKTTSTEDTELKEDDNESVG